MAEERHVALQAAASGVDEAASSLGHLQDEEAQVRGVRRSADEVACLISLMVAYIST